MDLIETNEEQCSRFQLILILLDLDPGCFQHLSCGILNLFLAALRADHHNLPGNQINDRFCSLSHILLGQQLPEFQPHRTFPCLAGYSGAGHAAINGGFGAAGVVPVHTTGGNGLQHMQVHIDSFLITHFLHPFFLDTGQSGKNPVPNAGEP